LAGILPFRTTKVRTGYFISLGSELITVPPNCIILRFCFFVGKGFSAPSFFVFWSRRSVGTIAHTTRRGSLPRSHTCAPLAQCQGRTHWTLPEECPSRGKRPEVIMIRPMAMRWTRTAIAHFPKIVDRLLHFGVLRGVVRKLRCRRRNIVSRPMVPCAGGRVGIVAEQDKTPRSGWRAGPLQRWREVFSIAGKPSRNCCTIMALCAVKAE
jgi:hypothetical protein